MGSSDALHTLDTFRRSFYECLHRRTDALFELPDALLTADAVPSPVHLSLEASHRRGWSSLYAALRRGRIDAEALRGLLASHPRQPSACWKRSDTRLCRGRKRMGSLRRGEEQPRARILHPDLLVKAPQGIFRCKAGRP